MITLDEFKKQVDGAADAYKASLTSILEKAIEAELDEAICVVIIEQSLSKKTS